MDASESEMEVSKKRQKLYLAMVRSKDHAREAARERVRECGVFNLQRSTCGYMVTICNEQFPCPALVLLYAKMGLHRYNFVQGTKFELSRVQKYVMTTSSAVPSYFITLDAIDPAAAGGDSSLQTFETNVSEYSFGQFILTCHIAIIRGELPRAGRGSLKRIDTSLPKFPPENPFETYYLVKESELQENAWIRLYLQLAVGTTQKNRKAKDFAPPNLDIVDVAIDANDEGLYAQNAVFYIRYKDSYKANLGHHLDRIAIVKRSFDKATGCFSLVGHNQSSDVIPTKPMIASEEDTGCSSFKGQNQSSEPPTQISSPLGISEDHEAANQLAKKLQETQWSSAGDSMELDSSSAQDN